MCICIELMSDITQGVKIEVYVPSLIYFIEKKSPKSGLMELCTQLRVTDRDLNKFQVSSFSSL